MIYGTLKNRRFVLKYDSTVDIPESLIDSLLRKTWEVTPSKNNFMAYTVHVIGQGPDNQKYKDATYLNCLGNEARNSNIDIANINAQRYSTYLPRYSNILNCSYLLIFTMRLETEPNFKVQQAIAKGHVFEAVNESKLDGHYAMSSLEVGLFTSVFNGLLLENGIDSSFIGCFSKDLTKWKDLPFITRKPIIIMTVGKGKHYTQQSRPDDLRPNYERIVNFVR